MSATASTQRPRLGVTFWLLAVALVALYAILVPILAALYGVSVPVAFLLGAGMCAAPLLALWYPRSSVAVFTVAAFVLPLTVSPDRDPVWPWPWSVPALILFALFVLTLTMQHGWRLGSLALLLGLMGSLAAPLLLPDAASAGAAGADLIVTASIATVAFVVGVLLAGRIRLGAELTREREHAEFERSRRELVEERTRIARELHDVVAHSMSLIQVQASTARFRAPGLPDEAIAEFDSIAATARSSLTEMRRILGVLRTEDHTAELAPQRGIDDIPALVDSTRRAGAPVDLTHEVEGEISAAVQIAVYRIVQESLSNAVRHAPGSSIGVSVTTAGDDVQVVVRNTPVPPSDPGTPGHGLRGMTERATLLGGEIHADRDGDGWTVSARIPRQPAATEVSATASTSTSTTTTTTTTTTEGSA
ncbi:sensor histidine kinase [Microbacterium sp. YJN-G]|uniref:sensor histidine kinase n=1 Tax=Microbacterium sp. YJN-G TaxID=2763257 RepID=UPI001D0C13E1|nr:sensor histidine kinase [Microbacterium sp. YJN-G]